MKQREKSDVFANRIHGDKKLLASRRFLIKDARFLPCYHFTHKMCTRKSAPFSDKNRFANRHAFRVYYAVIAAKNNALRATRNSLFCRNHH